MSADPTRETHPLLFGVVEQHVTYYRASGEYVSRNSIVADLKKDSQFGRMVDEAGINAESPNAMRAFRRVAWPVVCHYMSTRSGWWARRYGKFAEFFHEEWGTPEDCRDCANLRIRDRQKDEVALRTIVAICERKCGQLGWAFDPQYDDAGRLERVEVWAA